MDPIPAWLQKLWDAWDAPILVLSSLTMQIILFILGSRRRYTMGIWISIIVWSSYLTADWVATVALGKLSDITSDDLKEHGNSIDPTGVLRALWAPLLLLHLGGPDTITAYSMEDNQLWVRHLLGLVVQASVAIYVILMCWTNSWLSSLTVPLFLAGIIKYGERTWALWNAVCEQRSVLHWRFGDTTRALIGNIPGVELLRKANHCFDALKPHIASWADYHRLTYASVLSMDGYSDTDVFNIIEFELEFMYDVLYTKAPIMYSRAGFILRSISFFCTEIALWAFLFVAKPANTKEDIVITYVLLVGAVILDIYAVALLLHSDRAILWMMLNHKKPLVIRILKVVAPYSLEKWKRWSNFVGQFNLLSYCLETLNYEPPKFNRILKLFDIEATYLLETKAAVTQELKAQIVRKVKDMDGQRGSWPFSKRGEWSLEKYISNEDLKWSVQTEFDKSIILWHLATDICYCYDETESQPRAMSKLISDYMMYLLVRCPYMLSMVTGKKVFDSPSPNACSGARNDVHRILVGREPTITDRKEACRILLTEEPPPRHGVLAMRDYAYVKPWETAEEAKKLARILIDNVEGKWEIISSVWVEMLCYGASHCQLNYHEQRLRQGGELLTHVWLLLAHLKFDRPREEEEINAFPL